MMEKSQRAYDEFVETARNELLGRIAKGELSEEEMKELKNGEMFAEGLDKRRAGCYMHPMRTEGSDKHSNGCLE